MQESEGQERAIERRTTHNGYFSDKGFTLLLEDGLGGRVCSHCLAGQCVEFRGSEFRALAG